jgi:hypothetical protein
MNTAGNDAGASRSTKGAEKMAHKNNPGGPSPDLRGSVSLNAAETSLESDGEDQKTITKEKSCNLAHECVTGVPPQLKKRAHTNSCIKFLLDYNPSFRDSEKRSVHEQKIAAIWAC